MSNNTEKSTRPSSADYPVDPVERSNQEARLKKAAAAGASASKSPLPGLMLKTSSSAPVKPAEPQTVLAKADDSTNTDTEKSNCRSEPERTKDDVLAELRKISAWADLQRKISKWSLISLGVFIPIVIGIVLVMERNLQAKLESNSSPHQSDWYDAERSVRAGDFEKAIATGEELILKTPQDPDAHERLARVYLASGNLDKAREHYAEAFRLFPSEENEKLLNAIEKRVKSDKP